MTLLQTIVNHFTTKGELRAPSLSEFIDFTHSAKDIQKAISSMPGANKIGAHKTIKYHLIRYYNNFLKDSLQLSHILPVDKDGNVLEEPDNFEYFKNYTVGKLDKQSEKWYSECHKFNQALKECVYAFNGFEIGRGESYLLGNEYYWMSKSDAFNEVGLYKSGNRLKTHSDMVGQLITPQYFIKALNLKE